MREGVAKLQAAVVERLRDESLSSVTQVGVYCGKGSRAMSWSGRRFFLACRVLCLLSLSPCLSF